MPYFENLQAKLYFEEKGQGNVLIFLHGASLDMRQWKKEVAYFSSKYRVVTLDAGISKKQPYVDCLWAYILQSN